MNKRIKVIGGLALLIVIALAVGLYIYIKSVAPPGEEWIAYENEEVINSIDNQLKGMDVARLTDEKEALVVEKSISQLQEAVESGALTYTEITAIYLNRMKTLDQQEHGYNSVITVNPEAMNEARAADQARESGKGRNSVLYGIPVMLKDNINTSDMATSAGTVAFEDFVPTEDAQIVKTLKEQGAIILGKNNLSEFANYVSSVMPSGYSGRKGQTVNPFRPLKLSPSGSSSGSAVAVAANLVPVSIGTETAGSIIGPASANSVVGYKPSRESVSGEGIFPLIKKVDTPGPLAKTVEDIVIAYNAISDQDISLNSDETLKGKKIGVFVYEYNDQVLLQQLVDELSGMGAKVVLVEPDEKEIIINNLIPLSFKKDFEDFAKAYDLPIKELKDLLEFNRAEPERRMKYGQDLLEAADQVEKPDLTQIETSIRRGQKLLDSYLKKQNMDAVVFLGTSGSETAAAAGYPELAVPFTKDDEGVFYSATFVTGRGEDQKVLELGFCFERNVKGRTTLQHSDK